MLHPNIELRPQREEISCIIIQIMEITTTHSHSYLALQAYINLYTFTHETIY
jgi:hypothetical protein